MQASDTPGSALKSTVAVVAGFFVVVVLSLGTDQVLHMLSVYPPWGEPMYQPKLNLLALSYRVLFTIIGGYVTARFAPRNPMNHVLVLSLIGVVIGTAGVFGTWNLQMGPHWYPIAIAVTAFPCTWVGGLLVSRDS
jgi:hypothetical protein